jgi:hypothetical protein
MGPQMICIVMFATQWCCRLTHSEPLEQPLPIITMASEGDEIVANDLPVPDEELPAAVSHAHTIPIAQRVAGCEAGLEQLHLTSKCVAQIGLFVPAATILARLEACQLQPLDMEQKQLQGAAKRARYKH